MDEMCKSISKLRIIVERFCGKFKATENYKHFGLTFYEFIIKNNFQSHPVNTIIDMNNIKYLRYCCIKKRMCFDVSYNLCECISKIGNLDCLILAHKNGYNLKQASVIFKAIKHGHLDCLIYAHKNGCKLNSKMCPYAAKYGRLDCLIYLHENGCAINEEVYGEAFINENLNCLKYILSHYPDWNNGIFWRNLGYGNLECVKCVYDIKLINYMSWNDIIIKLTHEDMYTIDFDDDVDGSELYYHYMYKNSGWNRDEIFDHDIYSYEHLERINIKVKRININESSDEEDEEDDE
jgi:hypothetical protein